MSNTKTNLTRSDEEITEIIKLVARFLFTTVLMLGVLFLSAGRFDWWEAWVYVAMTIILLICSRIILLIKYPYLAKERGQALKMENVKGWDKILMPLTAIYVPFIFWVVAGLDQRFEWSYDLPNIFQICAMVVIFAGNLFGTWAMLSNRFFSSFVRIQSERGHKVICEGPYSIIRHPGYAGGILSWIAAPFFFSSFWAVIPSIIAIVASIIRTALEDHTLIIELPGYKEYAHKVRYRLIPGIW